MTNNPSPPLPDDRGAPFPVTPVSPDLLAWAQQTFDVDAFMAEMRETEANGGASFEDVLAAVKSGMRDDS